MYDSIRATYFLFSSESVFGSLMKLLESGKPNVIQPGHTEHGQKSLGTMSGGVHLKDDLFFSGHLY